ncbi:sulfurtransferase complex subunit TusB [Klebsiella pneumoniae]|uniref:Sulfurtransferase complex subunit TusB n=1 Tax=Klebsiella pneumoniae TaxID=573 RepID=A0A939NL69_KLEPN|nr:sulfurtransferase complex subunit TusB [Klebsiella pneumoniae]
MLRLMEHGDDLVLLSDGVTAAIADGRFLEILQSAPITLYVLQDDVDARGLAGQIADSVGRVSYTDFVRLTVKHAGQLAGDSGIVVYFLTPFGTALKFCVLIIYEAIYYVFTKQKLKPGAI